MTRADYPGPSRGVADGERHVQVLTARYADSVALMQVSQRVSAIAGVRSALVAMATPLNRELLSGLGFAALDAEPNDLLIAVHADDAAALAAGRAAAIAALDAPAESGPDLAGPTTPRTVQAALGSGATPPADLVLISVPGQYAAVEAMDAVSAGVDVLIFSDNVPVAAEVALKTAARSTGALVMGPDGGTAIVGGAGLGFANVVSAGPVALIAASGTGAQQLSVLLDEAGVGVHSVLGVGGRDLSAEVGGRSTLAALARLDADPAVERIVLLSKPPDPGVADQIRAVAQALGTPVDLALLGPGQPDLSAAAEATITALGRARPAWPHWGHSGPATGPALRGLFSGGTLCDEAMLIATERLGPIHSNIALRPQWTMSDRDRPGGHVCLDFGDDRLTVGRAHPMIDPSLRLERLAEELADPDCGVVLLDVVLGHAAHPDPAPALAELIADSPTPVIISLIGTVADPQDRSRQAQHLVDAGAEVFLSNAAAARRAIVLLDPDDGGR